MAIDFPASPTPGQIYQGYYWDNSKNAWRSQSTNRGSVITSATTPTGATAGDMWFNTSDGTMSVYYSDGITSQWVEIQANVDNYRSPSYNYIINGAFDIWQRGTSFSPAANSSVFTADRFFVYRDGVGSTVTVSQQTITPGSFQSGSSSQIEGQYFFRYAQTVAGSGATMTGIFHRIEDARTLDEQTVTLSFWAKADSPKTIIPNIQRNFGSGGSVFDSVSGSPITLTTSWQRYSRTFFIPTILGKTVGANSNLQVYLQLENNAVQTIDLWGIQLETGTVATPFRRNQPNIQAELAACQRYFCKSYDQGIFAGANNSNGICMATVSNILTTFAGANVRFPVTMRTVPSSVTLYGPTGTAGQADAVGFGGVSVSVSRLGETGIGALDVASGRSGGTVLVFHYIASAEL